MDPQPGRTKGRRSPGLMWRVVASLLALVVVAACDGGSTTNAADKTNSTDTSTSTAAPTSTTSSAPTTTTTTARDVSREVVATWDAFWEAWTTVRASEDLDPTPLQEVASPDVVEGVLALFERQRESGLDPVETEVVTHAKVTNTESDRVVIEDCVLLSPSFTESSGVWYEAELQTNGPSWLVADLRIRSVSGCVPAEMAADAIAGYGAYYEARDDLWDPPDPDHPLIDQVLADPQRGFVVGLLEQHEAQGVALRGQPAIHPEVTEVRSPTELVILSCLEPNPDYGLYDIETGERLPDEPPVQEGQRDLESAVMVYEGGAWKVSDLQGQLDFACEFAPTERGLPSV